MTLVIPRARPLDEAAALAAPAVPEDVLVAAHAIPLRLERCACGGVIGASFGDWEAIGRAVAAHNASTPHRRWRTVL